MVVEVAGVWRRWLACSIDFAVLGSLASGSWFAVPGLTGAFLSRRMAPVPKGPRSVGVESINLGAMGWRMIRACVVDAKDEDGGVRARPRQRARGKVRVR
jgi:hypothetical protein